MSNDRVPCPWCPGDVEPGTTCPKSIECPRCGANAGARCVAPSGHLRDTLHAARIELAESSDRAPAPVDVLPCPRCGQLAAPGTGAICDTCRTGERAPQGERLSLFTPAPTVPAGSLTMF